MPDIYDNGYNRELGFGNQGFDNTRRVDVAPIDPGTYGNPTAPMPQDPFDILDNITKNAAGLARRDNPFISNLDLTTPHRTDLDATRRYDDPVYGYNPFNRNIETQYGDRQGALEKWRNNLVKFGVNTAGAFIESLATIPLVIDAIANGDMSRIHDNPITSSINGWMDNLEDSLANYQTSYGKAHPVMDWIPFIGHSGDTWGGLLKNLGFTVGSIAGAVAQDALIGAATGGIGEAPLLVPQMMKIFSKIGKAFGAVEGTATTMAQSAIRGEKLLDALESAASAKKTMDRIRYGISTVTSALSEGTFEANRLSTAVSEQLHKDFFDRYHRNPTADETREFEKWSTSAGNVNLVANTALLTLTNTLSFGSILKPTGMAVRDAERAAIKGAEIKLVNGSVDTFEGVIKPRGKFELIKDFSSGTGRLIKTNITEGFEEGAQFAFQKGGENYYKHKFDDRAIEDVDNFTRSMSSALVSTLTTGEGLENIILGFMSGAVIHAGRGVIERAKGIGVNRDNMVASTVHLLNSERVSGVLADTYRESVTARALENKMQDDLIGNDIHEYKNHKFQQLFNFVSSGIRANRFDLRIDQLKLMKSLPQAEFEKMIGLDFTDENRRTVNERVDSMIAKAHEIKSSIDKVETVFGKNPFNRKTQEHDYLAFQDYKDVLALDLSQIKDNQKRIASLNEDLSGIAPMVNTEDIVRLTSERGVRETIDNFQKKIKEHKTTLSLIQDRESPEYQTAQKEIAWLEDKVKVFESNMENFDTDQYIYEVHDTLNYLANGNRTGGDIRISPIDTLEILTKGTDIYRLVSATDGALFHYQKLTSKTGADQYIADVKNEYGIQQAKFGARVQAAITGSQANTTTATVAPPKDADIEELDENDRPVPPTPPAPAAATVETPEAKAKDAGTSTEMSTNDTSPVDIPGIDDAAIPTPKSDVTAEAGTTPVDEKTPTAIDNQEQKEQRQQGNFLDRVFEKLNPMILFNKLFSVDRKEGNQHKSNLRLALFNSTPAQLHSMINFKVSESTKGNKHGEWVPFNWINTSGKKETIKGIYAQGYAQDVEVFMGDTPVGLLQAADRLSFKRKGQYLPLTEMTQEEYVKATGNDPSSFMPFIDAITDYTAFYKKIQDQFRAGKTAFSNEDIAPLFDLIPNYGNIERYQKSAATSTRIADLNYRGQGSAIISLPMIYDAERGVYERSTNPAVLNEGNLSEEEQADVWDYISKNIDKLRGINSRYIYLVKLPNGKFGGSSALAARPVEASVASVDAVFNTLKGVGDQLSPAEVKKINAAIADSLYIADSRHHKGNKNVFGIEVNTEGDILFKVRNNTVDRGNSKKGYNARIKIPNAKAANSFDDMIGMINSKVAEASRTDSTLSSLDITLLPKDVKSAILDDEAVESGQLESNLTVPVTPDIFDNFSLTILPNSSPKGKVEPVAVKPNKAKPAKVIPTKKTVAYEVARDKRDIVKIMQDVFGQTPERAYAIAEIYNRAAKVWAKRNKSNIQAFYARLKFRKSRVEDLQGAELFSKDKTINALIREGLNLGVQYNTDKVARERFDIGKLKLISQTGSDRDVYDLGNGMVVKIAKTARGLRQNMFEGLEGYGDSRLLPTVHERGLNYVVVEKLAPLETQKHKWVLDMIYTANALNNKLAYQLQQNNTEEANKVADQLQDLLIKNGFGMYTEADILYGDFSNRDNWGVAADGSVMLLDAGTLAGRSLIEDYKRKGDMEDAAFREVYDKSNEAYDKYKDKDGNLMYQKAEIDPTILSNAIDTISRTDVGGVVDLAVVREKLSSITPSELKSLVDYIRRAEEASIRDKRQKGEDVSYLESQQGYHNSIKKTLDDIQSRLENGRIDSYSAFKETINEYSSEFWGEALSFSETLTPLEAEVFQGDYWGDSISDSIEPDVDHYTEDYKKVLKPYMLNQAGTVTAHAAVQLMNDGTAIIHALTDPNVSSPLHELAHVWEGQLSQEERASVMDWAGHKQWGVETSEKFARGFEAYLAEGKAPSSTLQDLFDKFKTWLTEIYKGIVGSEIDVELNDSMRGVYAAMLGEKFEAEVAAVVQEEKREEPTIAELAEATLAPVVETKPVDNRPEFMRPIEAGGSYWGHLSAIQKAFVDRTYDDLLRNGKITEAQLREIVDSTKSSENAGLPQSLVDDILFRVNNQDLIDNIEYWIERPNFKEAGYVQWARTIKEVARNGMMEDAVKRGSLHPDMATDVLDSAGSIVMVSEAMKVRQAIKARAAEEKEFDKEAEKAEKKAEEEVVAIPDAVIEDLPVVKVDNEVYEEDEPVMIETYEDQEKVLHMGKVWTVIDITDTARGGRFYTINDGTKRGDKIVKPELLRKYKEIPESSAEVVEAISGTPIERASEEELRRNRFVDPKVKKAEVKAKEDAAPKTEVDAFEKEVPRTFRGDLDKELVDEDGDLKTRYDYAGLKTILERLKNKFNLPYKVVMSDENWMGRWKDGVVEINLRTWDKSTPFHEYLHPFVEAMKLDNRPLYDSLRKEFDNLILEGDELAGEIADTVNADEMYASESLDSRKDEMMVRYIAERSAMTTNKEGRRYKKAYSDAAKRLIDKFRAWINQMFKSLGILKTGVTTIPLTASLQDVADMVAISEIQFDLSDQIDRINTMEKYHSGTPLTDDQRRIANLKRKLRVLEDTGRRRLASDIITAEVITLRAALKAGADDAASIENYAIKALNGLDYANDEFARIVAKLEASKGKLSAKEVHQISRDLEGVKQLIAFYKGDTSFLLKRIQKGLSPRTKTRYLEIINNANATIESIKGKSIDLLTEWLFPYVETVNNSIKDKKNAEKFLLTKEKFRNSLYTADTDIDQAFMLLGSIANSKDAVSAVTRNAIFSIFEDNHRYEYSKLISIKTQYHEFLRKAGLANEEKATVEYYKKNYLRKATVREVVGKDDDGAPTYDYRERWAFHEEFYHDLFQRDMEREMDRIGRLEDNATKKEQDAFFNQMKVWQDANGQMIDGRLMPGEGYRNPAFSTLYNTDKFFRELYDTYKEGNGKLSADERLRFGVVPQAHKKAPAFAYLSKDKSITDNAKAVGGKVLDKILPVDEESTTSSTQKNLDGTMHKNITVPFIKMIEEENLVLTLPETVLAFAGSSNLVSLKREIDPTIRILKGVINGVPELAGKARSISKVTSKRKTIFDSILKLPASKEERAERLNKHLTSFIDDVMYGETEYAATLNIGGRSVDLNKLGANLTFLTALNNMALNVTAGISNVTIGNFMTLGESLGGKHYTNADWRKAHGQYGANIGTFLKDSVSLEKSKITQLGIKYDAIQGEFRDKYGKKFVGNMMQRYGNLDTIFFLSHAAEHQIQLTGMLALMNATKVQLKDGSTMSLFDAHEQNADGLLRLRKDAIWTKADEDNFTNKLHGINQLLNGNYSKFDKAHLQRLWYGKLLLVYRKYIYNGFRNRYGRERVDYQLGDIHEGYYRTFFNKLVSDVKNYKLDAARKFFTREGWSQDEKYAYNKTVFELTTLLGLTMLVLAIGGSDDKEKKKDGMSEWGGDYLLLNMVRLRSDIATFTAFGLTDMTRIIKNPSAVMGSLDRLAAIASQIYTDPTKTYTRKTGAFEKGDSILWAKVQKAIPGWRQWINLSTPEEQVKFYELIGKK